MESMKNLCYNCFKEKPQPEGPCPYCGFDLADNVKKYPVALRAGTILNNRYIVGRVLGQGGFGITYLAWDEKLAARVAVKEYMPNDISARVGTTVSVAMESRAEDFTYGEERFQEEARILAKFMGQPNIAGVTDYFDENGTSYFVMDYIEGISFKTYIEGAGGKVNVEEALDVMIPVLRALTAVHAEGFIHRDVTPDNIYITKDGNVKLLDFGSARYSIGDKSKSLDVILKVGYAPKEQYIRRGRQGPYTDVYSCAACLYAAITGYLPPESLERLDHDTLVPPSQMGVEIPLYLERAILKGLAVQPEDRFQTAGEFLEALESQQVVELPSGQSGQEAAQGTVPAKKKKPLPFILAGAAAVAVVFAAGTFLGGGIGGSEGSGGFSGGGNSVMEALASKVTIAGQEYSTAETELDLSGQDLTDADLVSLGQMENLVSLNLEGNSQISDLSPLGNLTKLQSLELPCPSEISDLSPLSGLTELAALRMVGNWNNSAPANLVKDFSPLSNLTSLTDLELVVTGLEDLSFASGLTNLRVLRLMGTVTAEDLTALSGLTNLTELQVHTSGTKTAAGIEGLVNLQSLKIMDESQSLYQDDLTCLSGMTNLKVVRFQVNGLKSFHGIENLTQLEEADFYGQDAAFTDLDPFRNLTKLEYLRLPRHTAGTVFNGDGLANLVNLQELDMEHSVESLEPLRNLKNLKILNMAGGRSAQGTFRSMEPLSGLTNLESLELNVPQLADVDLSYLSGMTKLTTLYISFSRDDSGDGDSVIDLTPLGSLTQLRSVELYLFRIRDLTPLAALPNLQSVTISGAENLDTSPLANVPQVNVQ